MPLQPSLNFKSHPTLVWATKANMQRENCAFITNIFLTFTPQKQGNYHPSAFDRLTNYLENLSIDDNDILWVIAILSYRAWEKEFEEEELILPDNSEMTFKENFYSLLYHE